MSQFFQNSSGSGGGVTSVTGTNGVTASPTTGDVVVSGVNATTSTVGVASFDPTQFTVSAGGQVSITNGVVFETTKTTLTSSQIKSLSGSPITVIPAPGPNKQINIVNVSLRYNYGGNNVFTGGSQIGLYVNTAADNLYLACVVFSTGVMNFSSTTSGTRPGNSIGTTSGVNSTNKPALITVLGADYAGNASNDNTIDIQIAYYISDL